MSDPVGELKRELLAAAERQQGQATLVSAGVAPKIPRRWLERAHVKGRRRVVALAAAVLVVVVGTASAFGGVRAFFLDSGFIGLAPLGATPSTPESGELEIFYWVADGPPGEGSDGRSRNWVYADGRLISDRFSNGLVEQRLTPEGLELLRSEILSTGALQPRAAPASAWAALSERRQSGHGRPAGHGRLRPLAAAASPWRAARNSLRNHDRGARCRPSLPRRSGERSVPPRGTADESGVVAAGKRVGRSRGKGVRAIHVRGLLRGLAARPTDRAVSPLDPATASGRGPCCGRRTQHGMKGSLAHLAISMSWLTTAPT